MRACRGKQDSICPFGTELAKQHVLYLSCEAAGGNLLMFGANKRAVLDMSIWWAFTRIRQFCQIQASH